MFEFSCRNCRHEWDLIEIDLMSDTVDEYTRDSDLCPICGSSEIVHH